MSGINTCAITERVYLNCQVCHARWESETYTVEPLAWAQRVTEAAPAFAAGWRVYMGKRTQHTYCPQHGPGVPMRQAYPRPIGGAR